MEDRKSSGRNYGTRRNYLRPGIENRERGFGFPTESVQNKNFWEDSICVNPQTEDGCQPESNCPGLPLAAAYVPMQPFTGLVGPDEALERGSSFDNLYIPYKKGGCA
ncbi:MAG: spore coat associated protein CotJA [Lachnospirales bacterium]